jgi:anti-sigma B factor antagonist
LTEPHLAANPHSQREKGRTVIVSVVSLEGEFDLSERTRLHEAFAKVRGAFDVIVDLTDVTYLDSTVVACLISLHRDRLKHKGRTLVAGLRPSTSRLFKITGLSALFEMASTLTEAISRLGADETSIKRFVLVADARP